MLSPRALLRGNPARAKFAAENSVICYVCYRLEIDTIFAWLKTNQKNGIVYQFVNVDMTFCVFSCLRLHQWSVSYLITLSDWIMSCQPGRHAVVTVCEQDWKHKWAAYKSFDETSSFNNLWLLFLGNRSLQILQQYVMCPPRGMREISMGFSL